MRILVTGHGGYIGTVLVPLLARAGHDVVGIESMLFDESAFGRVELDCETRRLDVRDLVATDVDGFEAVIHLAGLSNDPLGAYRPELTDAINHKATVRLARLAREVGVERFLFASSCSNYGSAGDDFIDEQGVFRPITPYARSKADAEAALKQLATERFSPVFIRAATAYGASPMLRFDLVLNNLMAWAYTTKRVHLKSDGTPWRPITHVQDISRAYLAAAEAPRETVHNRAYNVGSTTENYRVSELAAIVAETVDGSAIDYASDAGPDTRCYRVDCNRIARELPAYKPQWTARRGAQQLLEAFREVDLTVEDVEGARYNRIAHVISLIEAGSMSPDLRWHARRRATA
jgi:nucleoside-diphosphate-sugar epimerase